jgi:hypothetical protein
MLTEQNRLRVLVESKLAIVVILFSFRPQTRFTKTAQNTNGDGEERVELRKSTNILVPFPGLVNV